MAKYMILIYGDEQRWDSMTAAERRELEAGHADFAVAAAAGVLEGAELASTTVTTSLRLGPTGEPVVTDGPFLETKEVLGGFYVLEAADLDAAIALVRRLPEVRADHSGIEIRPMLGSD